MIYSIIACLAIYIRSVIFTILVTYFVIIILYMLLLVSDAPLDFRIKSNLVADLLTLAGEPIKHTYVQYCV